MKTNVLKLAICGAWAALAMSAATPSSARALTEQAGDYAACSHNEYADPIYYCDVLFNYAQSIKFIGSPCSSGGCADDLWWTGVESLYDTGRKTTSFIESCYNDQFGYGLWNIGSCEC